MDETRLDKCLKIIIKFDICKTEFFLTYNKLPSTFSIADFELKFFLFLIGRLSRFFLNEFDSQTKFLFLIN